MESIPQLLDAVQEHVLLVLAMLAGIWGLHILNVLVGYRICILGIYPRSIFGLLGILFSPFLHGDFNHLFFNSIPLFVLANFVMLDGQYIFYLVTGLIMVMSGFSVWLFGRKALHVGASSLIVGYWSYLLLAAYVDQSALGVVVGVVSLYYFGGLFFSIFPSDLRTSWEGHLSGFLSGIATFYIIDSPIIMTWINSLW